MSFECVALRDKATKIKRMSEFELANFIPQTLSLSKNIVPQTTPSFTSKPAKDLLEGLLKEDPLKILGETVVEWKSTNEDRKNVETPLQRFYSGVNILITGGTGFVGKVLIQKLIRSFTNIGQIYLLIREKRGATPQQRLRTLLEDQVFLRMQTEAPQYLSKITVVEGDISEPGLGLKSEDRKMLIDNVNIIFHSAANVKFNEALKSCLQSNLVGSRRVIALAKEVENLKVFVHVSTAYSHCVRRVIEEKCYQVNVNYVDILKYTEMRTEQEIDEETPRLLQGWPNTYTFCKALTEDMIQKEAKDLPICIYRPTVVMTTYKDPVKGWTDNIYGPNGILLGMALGIIHVFRCDVELALDLVPVDYVVNSLIAVAADVASTERANDSIPVVNYASTPTKRITWKRMHTVFNKYKYTFPFESAIWIFTIYLTESKLKDKIGHLLFHKIPGKMLDLLTKAAGEKPRLSTIYDKFDFTKKQLEFFTLGVWEFRNKKISLLWNKLDKADQEMFPFDVADVEFESVIPIFALGMRYYFMKEKMETMSKSARKLRWLKWAHYSLVTVVCLTMVKVASLVAHALPI